MNTPIRTPDHVHHSNQMSRRTLLGGSLILATLTLGQEGPVAASGPPRVGFTVSPSGVGGAAFANDVAKITALGAGWIRFSVLPYDVVDAWNVGGDIVWNSQALDDYDDALDVATTAGLKVCFLTVDGVTGVSDSTYLDVMAPYWNILAERFGDRIDVWQVFNEADGLDFKDHTELPNGLDEIYLDRLHAALGAARAAIHAEYPQIAITTNASGYPINDAVESLWHVYFGGIDGNLDLLTVDLYPQTSSAAIASLPTRLADLQLAFNAPVAVGEFGLQTGPGLFSEAQQSQSVCDTMVALAGSVAQHSIVYGLRDEGNGDPTDGFGIYKANGVPKSSVAAIQSTITQYYPNG